MPAALDLTGDTFGRLTVVARAEKDRWGAWLCDDCGLSYDRHMVASYVDDDARPCAKSCTASWHRPDSLTATPGLVYECRTCALPTGHTSDCWTNCTTRYTPKEKP